MRWPFLLRDMKDIDVVTGLISEPLTFRKSGFVA